MSHTTLCNSDIQESYMMLCDILEGQYINSLVQVLIEYF